jgi:molybdopterin/thiamine biosynthesis adenylyltransferase
MIDRYARQTLFPGIGPEGQKKLAESFVVIIGCGALGTLTSTALVRAGVGRIRIVDRDFIESHNLQRQVIFDEDDIKEGLPKAIAAERHLRKVNSSIKIEGVVADVNYTNIEELVSGAEVIVDGLDNLDTRFLLNDVALKLDLPWVYGGAVSSHGMTATFVPHTGACFRCLAGSGGRGGPVLTCDTAGVISPAPWLVGSLQSAETLKLLVGASEVNHDLIAIDVWLDLFQRYKMSRRPDCPACNGKYEFLEGKFGIKTTSLCGQNSVQVLNTRSRKLSFKEMSETLRGVGGVTYNDFMLRFTVESHEVIVFADGRAIIKDTTDEGLARRLYTKYVGA